MKILAIQSSYPKRAIANALKMPGNTYINNEANAVISGICDLHLMSAASNIANSGIGQMIGKIRPCRSSNPEDMRDILASSQAGQGRSGRS